MPDLVRDLVVCLLPELTALEFPTEGEANNPLQRNVLVNTGRRILCMPVPLATTLSDLGLNYIYI